MRPVYLLVGEEHYLATKVLAALSSAALEGSATGLNEDVMTAGDVEVDAVLAAARTLPMMGPRRLVVVRSLERWEPKGKPGKQKKNETTGQLDRLADYAARPSPETTLLLVASKLDKRRRLAASASKGGWLVSCDPLRPRDLPRWIEGQARRMGHRMSSDLAELVAELAGPELNQVADALERVCLYVGSGADVTEDAIAECIVRTRPTTVWEVVDAVGRRQPGAALGALARAYDPRDRGLRLVPVLAWSARQLLKFEAASRSGASPETAAKRAGAPPFRARELASRLRGTSRRDLERWLQMLAQVDLALKGGSGRPPLAILEHAVMAMCAGGVARRRRLTQR